MKAIVRTQYGPPELIQLKEVPRPVPADNEVLIRIYAVSINGSDREALVGSPFYVRMGGLWKPGYSILGSDVAGRIEEVGKDVTQFQPGDEVFGELPGYQGGFAEYACATAQTLLRKPDNLTFEEAACLPQGGVIAWRGIHEQGKVQSGQSVLINGAGGSAGVLAVQLARLYGAEVTGVDNSHKLDFLRSLGANHVFDYAHEDFTRSGKRYDLILDLIAQRSAFAYPRALNPRGTYFFTGGSVRTLFQILLFGPWIRKSTGKSIRLLMVPQNNQDLKSITELCVSGRIKPVIDKLYPLQETQDAMRYILAGHAKGKVVITINQDKVS